MSRIPGARLLLWPIAALPVLGLAGCVSAPPIGANLPRVFAEGDVVFNARVQQRFPVGSSEAALVTELQKQRFKVDRITPSSGFPYEYRADRESGGVIACVLDWMVFWSAKDGRITAIKGSYGATCL